MKLALCDNNAHDLAALTALLEQYRVQRNIDSDALTIDAYSNATELVFQLQAQDYHVLILEAVLPGINGIEVAREIRQYNHEVQLIFLSASAEYALDSYTVDAFYYFLKPMTAERLFPVLDRLWEHFAQPADLLHIKTSQQIFSIPFSKIEYVEITGKKLHFYLTNGTTHAITAPLSEYEPLLLARPEFVKTHRSYLVNLQHMKLLEAGQFVSEADNRIPISRRVYKAVREQYVQYLLGNKT